MTPVLATTQMSFGPLPMIFAPAGELGTGDQLKLSQLRWAGASGTVGAASSMEDSTWTSRAPESVTAGTLASVAAVDASWCIATVDGLEQAHRPDSNTN